jgi:hypothetical protein
LNPPQEKVGRGQFTAQFVPKDLFFNTMTYFWLRRIGASPRHSVAPDRDTAVEEFSF